MSGSKKTKNRKHRKGQGIFHFLKNKQKVAALKFSAHWKKSGERFFVRMEICFRGFDVCRRRPFLMSSELATILTFWTRIAFKTQSNARKDLCVDHWLESNPVCHTVWGEALKFPAECESVDFQITF